MLSLQLAASWFVCDVEQVAHCVCARGRSAAHVCCVCVCEVQCILTVPLQTEVVETDVSAHQKPCEVRASAEVILGEPSCQ